MTVFLALLVDAYRELNSRKLFWVVFTISLLFVMTYASIGFDKEGMFILYGLKHFDSPLLSEGTAMSKLLYRGIFATFVVPIWLAWIASILALISTAPIFPEFVSGGSIDLVLCKPIRRIWLFLCKYLCSLLFVVLQVTVFCVGVFLAMGWRIGDWEWKVFLAIPLVSLVYSYLYSVCVLVGLWTRSTLAALLLTLLFWFSLYMLNSTDAIVLMIRSQMAAQIVELDEEIDAAKEQVTGSSRSLRHSSLPELITQRKDAQELVDSLDYWRGWVRLVRWPMPKTSDTIGLMDRQLSREGDINLMDLISGRVRVEEDGKPRKSAAMDRDERAHDQMTAELDRDGWWFIIGTSLMFELFVLSLAAWIFCRRDF